MKQALGEKPEYAAIRRVIAAIPRGKVTSYGEIAVRAGLPGRARLVGRVLRSNGRFAFAPGSRGFREQRARLLEEGVAVVAGRVDIARFGWQRNLDAELWAMR